MIGLQLVPGLRVVLAIPSEEKKIGKLILRFPKKLTECRGRHRVCVYTSSDVLETYETSGFFRASRAKYITLMVAPPPMKMKRGMSW